MAPRGYWHRFSHLQHQSGTSHGQSMEVMWSTAFSSATWSFHFILLHFLAIIPPFISALNSMSLIFKTSLESHTHIKDIKKKNHFPISDQHLTMAFWQLILILWPVLMHFLGIIKIQWFILMYQNERSP